jgi:hypothetical protein
VLQNLLLENEKSVALPATPTAFRPLRYGALDATIVGSVIFTQKVIQ